MFWERDRDKTVNKMPTDLEEGFEIYRRGIEKSKVLHRKEK